MGNRAVITFGQEHNSPCIYLHWNGGRASVEAFLEAARQLGLRHCPQAGKGLSGCVAEQMVMDVMAEMIASYFFGCQIGVNVYRSTYGRAATENGDNGVYLLNRDMTIGGRLFASYGDEINASKTASIVEHIVQRAPAFTD